MPRQALLRNTSFLFATCGLAVAGIAAVAPARPALARVVIDTSRPDSDKAQDAARKPAMMIRFAQIKPKQTVVELLPGDGYFTRVFSNAVGARGRIIAVEPGKKDMIRALSRDPRRGNIFLSSGAFDRFAADGTVDIVWTSRNYHDLKGPSVPADTAARVNKAAFAALKPGGYYVVLDHSAAPGSGTRDVDTLHRIDAETVKAEVIAAGFVLDDESPLLANPDDARTAAVFDPSIKGRTDQFILRFKKPG